MKLIVETVKDNYTFPLPKHIDKSDMETMLRKDMQTNLSFLEVVGYDQQTVFINKNNIIAVYLVNAGDNND